MLNLKKTIAKSVAAVAVAGFALGAQAQNLIANGGFESTPAIFNVGSQPGPGGQGAGYWLTPGVGAATLSNDAHTGAYSAAVTCPQLCGSTLFGNSADNGGLTLDQANWGTTPTFSFWAKGQTGTTGNLTWALRFLDGTGNILAGTTGQNLNSVNPNTWTQFTTALAIPTGTVGVFFETTFAIGPVGQQGPTLFTGGGFVIDDISLQSTVTAVPEPESYAMMLAGLVGVGGLVRRRRKQ
jgi:hypothetical protein